LGRKGSLMPDQLSYITQSSMVMSKEENCSFLEEMLDTLSVGPAPQEPVETRIPLYLTGCLCHIPKADVMRLIHNLGSVIVGDDFYGGRRYFEVGVPELLSWEGLARYHAEFDLPSATTLYGSIYHKRDWALWAAQRAMDSGAQGVIILIMRYCEPLGWQVPRLQTQLESLGLPYILVEVDHEQISLHRVDTQLRAFIEQLGEVSHG